MDRYGFANEAEALAYGKNPVDNLVPLAKAKEPRLHIHGDVDECVQRVIECVGRRAKTVLPQSW